MHHFSIAATHSGLCLVLFSVYLSRPCGEQKIRNGDKRENKVPCFLFLLSRLQLKRTHGYRETKTTKKTCCNWNQETWIYKPASRKAGQSLKLVFCFPNGHQLDKTSKPFGFRFWGWYNSALVRITQGRKSHCLLHEEPTQQKQMCHHSPPAHASRKMKYSIVV